MLDFRKIFQDMMRGIRLGENGGQGLESKIQMSDKGDLMGTEAVEMERRI